MAITRDQMKSLPFGELVDRLIEEQRKATTKARQDAEAIALAQMLLEATQGEVKPPAKRS